MDPIKNILNEVMSHLSTHMFFKQAAALDVLNNFELPHLLKISEIKCDEMLEDELAIIRLLMALKGVNSH